MTEKITAKEARKLIRRLLKEAKKSKILMFRSEEDLTKKTITIEIDTSLGNLK